MTAYSMRDASNLCSGGGGGGSPPSCTWPGHCLSIRSTLECLEYRVSNLAVYVTPARRSMTAMELISVVRTAFAFRRHQPKRWCAFCSKTQPHDCPSTDKTSIR